MNPGESPRRHRTPAVSTYPPERIRKRAAVGSRSAREERLRLREWRNESTSIRRGVGAVDLLNRLMLAVAWLAVAGWLVFTDPTLAILP